MKVRVLLIEDNKADQAIIKTCLESNTYKLKTVSTLEEAIASLEKTYDLVLMDLGLPDSKGISTYHKVRDRAPALPIIVLSGINDQQIALDAISKGAQDFLVKGKFNPRNLSRTIRFALLRHEMEKMKVEKEKIKERENFSAMLNHNLRVPLIGMENVLHPLINGVYGELSEEVKEAMKTLLRATNNTHSHIKRALEAYQLNSKESCLPLEKLDLNEILNRCIEEVKHFYAKKNVSIHLEISDELPNLTGNEYSIYTLFLNLIDNALKFSPQGETIQIFASAIEQERVLIALKNKGQPIPQDKQEKAFEYFFSTSPQNNSGMARNSDTGVSIGVGLYLCKRIVSEHGGTIKLASDSNGTKVVVELPLTRDSVTF